MRRAAKPKAAAKMAKARKPVLTASAAARRAFPAWIDASDRTVPFAASTVQPRVRDALVLRQVTRKSDRAKGTAHDPDAR